MEERDRQILTCEDDVFGEGSDNRQENVNQLKNGHRIINGSILPVRTSAKGEFSLRRADALDMKNTTQRGNTLTVRISTLRNLSADSVAPNE